MSGRATKSTLETDNDGNGNTSEQKQRDDSQATMPDFTTTRGIQQAYALVQFLGRDPDQLRGFELGQSDIAICVAIFNITGGNLRRLTSKVRSEASGSMIKQATETALDNIRNITNLSWVKLQHVAAAYPEQLLNIRKTTRAPVIVHSEDVPDVWNCTILLPWYQVFSGVGAGRLEDHVRLTSTKLGAKEAQLDSIVETHRSIVASITDSEEKRAILVKMRNQQV